MDKTVIRLVREPPEHLQHLLDLLHLFAHRNQNQHRRSIWWRSFSTLRRNLNKVVDDIECLRHVPATHSERVKKKAEDKQTSLHLQQQLQHWQDVMVAKWFQAFSQVVADGRFAVLGLVLTAVLSDVSRILGIISAYEGLAQAEVEKVLDKFAKETWDGAAMSKQLGTVLPSFEANEDVGELVARSSVARGLSESPSLAHKEPDPPTSRQLPPKRKPDEERSAARKSKKRRKGNAIDDLFSGLG